MLGFVLALHQLTVWLIELAALVTVALGVAWLILRRTPVGLATGHGAPEASAAARPDAVPEAAPPAPASATPAPAPASAPPPLLSAASIREYFRYGLIVTAALGAAQAVFGGLLLLMGQRPADALHYVYGLIVLLAIPVAYAYSGEAPEGTPLSQQGHLRREFIILTVAALAVAAAAIRAWMTGAGVGH